MKRADTARRLSEEQDMSDRAAKSFGRRPDKEARERDIAPRPNHHPTIKRARKAADAIRPAAGTTKDSA